MEVTILIPQKPKGEIKLYAKIEVTKSGKLHFEFIVDDGKEKKSETDWKIDLNIAKINSRLYELKKHFGEYPCTDEQQN